MLYGNVPGVNRPISRLVQGTASFNTNDPESCFQLMDLAMEYGFNTFDHGRVYGPAKEKVIGDWIKDRNVRDQVNILAKCAHHDGDKQRVTPEDIEDDLNVALTNMGLEYVELFVMHRDNPEYPIGPIVEAMNKHIREGRIGAYGGSNWTHGRVAAANAYAAEHGLVPMAISNPNFSLAEQVKEPWFNCVSIGGPQGAEARNWYEHSPVALFTWSSLAGGFFSDRYTRENAAEFANDLAIRCYGYEQNWERLDRVRELARRKDVSVPQIALTYVMSQPLDIFALVFCADRAQFAANAAAIEMSLTPEEMAWLDLRGDAPAA